MSTLIPDACNEVHGLNDAKKHTVGGYTGALRILVIADGEMVRLSKSDADFPAGLNPAQARYLADKLYHCAALCEQRAARPGK